MFCDKCGKEIPDNSRFCGHCGKLIKKTNYVVHKKNMLLALFLSLLLMGLGVFYAGNRKKGIVFFAVILLFNYLRHTNPIFFVIAMIIWIYSIYETYREVKRANGEKNPDLIEDIKNLPNEENIAPLVAMALLIFVYILLIRMIFY